MAKQQAMPNGLPMDATKFSSYVYRNYDQQFTAYLLKTIPNGEDAKDLKQDFYLKLHLQAEKLRSKYIQFGTRYLMTTLKNICIDFLRNPKKKPFLEWDTSTMDRSINHYFYFPDEVFDAFYTECLTFLSATDAQIFTLQVKGFKYQEIANQTGFKANNVGVRIHRARGKTMRYLRA